MDNIVADAEAGTRFPLLLLEVFGGIACFPASACLESFLRPCKSGLLSSISGSNTKFVRLLNVMALVFALGVMFAAAACGQGRSASGSAIDAAEKQRIEQLYADDADAWSRHDIAKIVSFFDPACVFVAPDGKRTSYAQWRQNLPESLAQERHSQVKTTVKALQVVENGFVASIESQDSYEIYDTKRSAWIPMVSSLPQEDTWSSDGRGNFKIVFVKFLRVDTSPVVVQSSGYQLTEGMLQQALRFGQILAGADFSPSDAAALRSDLIADFQKEPAKQVAEYESVAKTMPRPSVVTGKNTWLELALVRYRVWQVYAENPDVFRSFQSYPFGRVVLKYNPVLVNSGGMIVTKTDVECQFYADNLVAQAAGVPPPAQTVKDEFIRSLPSRFASLPREQQEYLRRAELRLQGFYTVYIDTINTRAVVAADIRKNVHSSADVWREARQVENDAEYTGKYYQLYRNEAVGAVLNASRVIRQQQDMEVFNHAIQGIMRTR